MSLSAAKRSAEVLASKRKDGSTTRKKRRFEEAEVTVTTGGDEEPKEIDHDKIKQMMENARKQIEKRKSELKRAAPKVKVDAEAAEKARRALELQARIQAKMASRPGLLAATAGAAGAMTNLIAQITNTPNSENNADLAQSLAIPTRTLTLKANIRAKKREEFKHKLQLLSERPKQHQIEKEEEEDDFDFEPAPPPKVNKYFDPRVRLEGPTRQKKQMKFNEKGKFISIAQKIRTKTQLEKLQSEISQAAKRTGIEQASRLALAGPRPGAESDGIPETEWWDAFILSDNKGNDPNLPYHGISKLIEHPIQINEGDKDNAPTSVYLTKKERKKVRRLNRREALKDEQEKVRLGLVPAPEPKVKLSNLMRVLGNDAVQDPTKVEQHVRAQMAKRKRDHEHANAARKLTKQQQREKKVKKLKEDTSAGVHVTIYRVRNLRDPAKKFKVEANSKQLYMTGCVVMHRDINVIVVEGGPKAQKKFKRLMLIRVDWNEDKKGKYLESDDDDEPGEKKNKCELIWEGFSKTRSFKDMIFKQCATEQQAIEFFKKHMVEHYWDLAHAQKIFQG